MLAARMHGYRQSLVLEEVNIPEISSDQVLVRVGGAGMCRSGVQLIDGYFQAAIKPKKVIKNPMRVCVHLLEFNQVRAD